MMDTVAAFVATLGSIVTAVISWLGEVLTFMTSNPIIFVPMLMFFVVGGTVGILLRILRG